ncbi:MAG: glycosyltransferase, partial [Candidatus Omnitrophica bacterium]|nr:glycosyltransferase [Candidatus Omnitrophota bacterium]
MHKTIAISIIIPVKNGGKTLKSCLDGIYRQTLFSQSEIIIIDSGSIDNTFEVLKHYPEVKVYRIPPEQFNHGTTRNYGVSLAYGEYVVMTVQDASAVDEYWLERMCKHFSDLEVAAVCGLPIVLHDKDKDPHQWFRPVSKPSIRKIQFKNKQDFLDLTPAKQRELCALEDVTAMYRKSALEEIPFQKTDYAEDVIWAREALLAGKAIVFDKFAKVCHYHFYDRNSFYKRIMSDLYYDYLIFGLKRKFPYNFNDYFLVIYRNFKYKTHPKWIFFNFFMLNASRRAFKDF